ncbi:type I-E CRISPR-associated protein Cse2/CasB [Streptomyces smyrnaeus]|uniref:type I-E CRISPR-associated protein Cse2/CasB n=2 Tax=Streptomyces smyrnaeus TaxID=1387713 RepID=UPI0036BD153B
MTSSMRSRPRETWWWRLDLFVRDMDALARSDTGARAALRSGVRQPVTKCARMHRYLARHVSETWPYARQQPYYTVAALIADSSRQPTAADEDPVAGDEDTGPDSESEAADAASTGPGRESAAAPEGDQVWWDRCREANLGAALARGVRLPGKQALNQDTTEKRLHLLTRSSSHTLHTRLPELTRYLRSREIAVDWAVLLGDLAAWERSRDEVATRWLQTFYRTLHPSADEA